ncbi:hypothetical protein GGI15_000670 [Coemansia interrupta]|uniref:snRNA-activating protein complex subunit 3 n=1 Tax=Coemansia interrupta TaxID=1126814 RepID=A0A9W8LPB4_9FUNG|nr:hypothetical protein GGI15_000670 [Coemansia interrupta]
MPPSDLINVRNFRDKFAGLVRGQKERGVFNAQSEWSSELYDEVASRCQIADELSFSNATFVNPTLFHMLRQHREFNEATERELLKKKRDVADELERKRQQKMAEDQEETPNGVDASSEQINGDKGGGQESMLLAVDSTDAGQIELGEQAMEVDKSTVDDALARLVGNTLQAPGENSVPAVNIATNSNSNGTRTTDLAAVSSAGHENDDSEDERASVGDNSKGGDHGSDEESVDVDTSDDEKEPNTTVSQYKLKSASVAVTPLARRFDEITLRTPQSELPEGITFEMLRKAVAESGYARSTDVELEPKQPPKQRVRVEEPAGVSELENKFRNVKNLLDESTLASLRKANRRMVPPKYRLEVNFMTNRVQTGAIPNATPVADDEVILSVCFYNTRSTNSKMEEYMVLGSQSLTVLRDAFYCISDFLVSHRDETIENTRDKKVSSSYFFIENTFYNDMRSPTATDYSRVILEWANDPERQEKNPKLRGLQSRLMDGARFLDLSIRLKQPYTFVHQGDCEHVMIFTDLRLLGPKDDQFVENYPKQIFRTRHMRHKCRMCSAYPAQYVTKNDFHSGMSPCYFCEKCYTPFHFDKDGNKLLEHDVFPYANVNLM